MITLIFYRRIIHGPAALDLPQFGLMQDGTRCDEGHVCMGAKCILVDMMAAMICPLSSLNVMCSNNGVSYICT